MIKNNLTKIIVIAVVTLVIVIVVIFFTRWLIPILTGGTILGGAYKIIQKLLAANKEADIKIDNNKRKDSEANNVILHNKTDYATYKDAVDSLSSDADLLNENARLRAERKKAGLN